MAENVIYKRQKSLNLRKYRSFGVIGAGGIGSWVALDLALAIEGLERVVIVDFDDIELHNLNRTPYRYFDVGRPKVEALAELIMERRPDIEVIPYNGNVEDPEAIKLLEDVDFIVDARDNLFPLPPQLRKKTVFKLGYDGFTITIMMNPKYDKPVQQTYETVPSYLVPPQLLAALATHMMLSPNLEKFSDDEYYTTITIDDIVETLYLMKKKKKGVN